MKKRILYITVTTINDGPGNQLGMLIGALDRTRYEPIVLTIRSRGSWQERYKSMGIKSINLGLRIPFDLIAPIVLVWHMLRIKPDLVQTQMIRADIYGRLAAYVTRTPFMTVVHNQDVWKRSGKPFDWLTTLIDTWQLRRTKRTVAVSQAIKDDVIRQGAKKDGVTVVKNAIEVERFSVANKAAAHSALTKSLSIPSDALIIASTHRFTHQKAPEVWLEAVTTITKKYPHVHAVAAGDGPLFEQSVNAAKQMKLQNVHFLGAINTVPQLLAGSDIFVLTSRFEGLPLSLLEAMASECACVATRVSGTPEAMTHDKTGLLIPPDNPVATINALSMLIEQPQLRKRLAKEARKDVAQQFHKKRMADEYDAVYQELLS